MIDMQNSKFLVIKADVLSTTAAETSDAVDCKGYNYATFLIGGEVATATDASQTLSSLILKEGDTTSSFANITEFVGGTAFTIPVNNLTTQHLSCRFNVDLRKRKRYLQVSMHGSAAAAANTFAFVVLSRANNGDDADLISTSTSPAGVTTIVTA